MVCCVCVLARSLKSSWSGHYSCFGVIAAFVLPLNLQSLIFTFLLSDHFKVREIKPLEPLSNSSDIRFDLLFVQSTQHSDTSKCRRGCKQSLWQTAYEIRQARLEIPTCLTLSLMLHLSNSLNSLVWIEEERKTSASQASRTQIKHLMPLNRLLINFSVLLG